MEKRLTPTLRNALEAILAELYRGQLRRTARELALSGDPAAAEALPAECPYTLAQPLDEDWFATSRHGST